MKNKFINRFFPKRFDKYWKKIEDSKDVNDTLRYITNTFIKSKSYKLVSNYWHVLNIANYKSLSMFGVKMAYNSETNTLKNLSR